MTIRPLATTMFAFGVAFAAPAIAQEAAPAPAPEAQVQPEAQAAAEFSDAQIEAFAQVALQVAEVRDTYAARLASAQSEVEQQQIVEEGNTAMLAAVEDSGVITLDEYLEIGEAAAADPALGERIAMVIDQMGQPETTQQ